MRKIEILLGTVLIAAAAMKALSLFPPASNSGEFLLKPGWIAIAVELELIPAMWLVAGGFPGARFIAAVASFSIFAAVASYEAFHAMPSCGCFGSMKVPPVATAAFDVSAVVALLLALRASQGKIPHREGAKDAKEPGGVRTGRSKHSQNYSVTTCLPFCYTIGIRSIVNRNDVVASHGEQSQWN